jgi:hypothetical protein
MRDKTELPDWKRRRWVLLNKFLNDPETKKYLKENEKWADDSIVPLKFFGFMAERQLPEDCWDAVNLKLKNPQASDEELIAAIKSPVEYISNFYKVRGPASDPKERYEDERWRVERRIETYGTDKAYEDTGVYLRITPFTSLSEVQSFIKSNWAEIEPLLGKANHESDGLFDPEKLKPGVTRLRDRGKREAIDAHIVELHSEGNRSPVIRLKVHDKYGIWIDESNIRAIVSRYNKRKSV